MFDGKDFELNGESKIEAVQKRLSYADFWDFGTEGVVALGLYLRSQQMSNVELNDISSPNAAVISAFRAEARSILDQHVRANLDKEMSRRVSEAEAQAADEMKKAGLSSIPERVDEIVRINLDVAVKPLNEKIERSGSFLRQSLLALMSSAFITLLTIGVAYLVYISPINPLPPP